MKLKKFILYLMEWLTPSCTAAYIVLTDKIQWGTYMFWGYAVNIPSYILASLAGAAIFYYLNKYIFKSDVKEVIVTVDGSTYTMRDGDNIRAVNNIVIVKHKEV